MGSACLRSADYQRRVDCIRTRVRELDGRRSGVELHVDVGRDPQALTRTSSAVWITDRLGRAVKVELSREEFLDEYGLFERGAVPRIQRAVRTLSAR